MCTYESWNQTSCFQAQLDFCGKYRRGFPIRSFYTTVLGAGCTGLDNYADRKRILRCTVSFQPKPLITSLVLPLDMNKGPFCSLNLEAGNLAATRTIQSPRVCQTATAQEKALAVSCKPDGCRFSNGRIRRNRGAAAERETETRDTRRNLPSKPAEQW